MTRYARARGSKASNERLPEEATPWSSLKRRVEQKKFPNNNLKEVNTCNLDLEYQNPYNKNQRNIKRKIWEEFDDHFESPSLSGKINKTSNVKKLHASKIRKTITSCNLDSDFPSSSNKNQSNTETKVWEEFDDSFESPSLSEKINKTSNVKKLNTSKGRKNIAFCNLDSDRPNSSNEGQEITETKVWEKFDDHFESPSLSEKINKTSNYKKLNSSNEGQEVTETKVSKEFDDHSESPSFSEKINKKSNFKKLNSFQFGKNISHTQAERRREEKSLARTKKVECFKCRKFGHKMSDCLESGDSSGMCFKCGSTEHSVNQCRIRDDSFKFAHCFICQEEGHIARQCPDNPRGLYPKGGACKMCGDVTHLRKDCPELVRKKEKSSLTVAMVHNNSIEELDEELIKDKRSAPLKRTNIVKF